ncbi:keratin-like protein KRT222 [Lissotriton helveticus]
MSSPRQPGTAWSLAGLEHLDAKGAMKELNERLAGYIAHVGKLEEANLELERKILEELGKREPKKSADWSQKEQACQDLVHAISQAKMKNASLAMDIHCKEMDLNTLKQRCETEHAYRKHLGMKMEMLQEMEAEVSQLIPTLQAALEDMHRENAALKLDHEEALRCRLQAARPRDEVLVAAEEDGSAMALSQLLAELRGRYEELLFRSPIPRGLPDARAQLEKEAAKSLAKDEADLKEARAELKAARRQWMHLQVEMESLHAKEKGLHKSLFAMDQQYQSQLHDMSTVIEGLETELQDVRQGMQNQLQQHQDLLNTKMRLEQEIQTYRSLLEGEEHRLLGFNHNRENGNAEINSRQINAEIISQSKGLPNGVTAKYATDGTSAEELEEEVKTVKTSTVLNGKILKEGVEACGTIQTENVDKVIKQWEGSFFKDNPHLRKKSASLRFDLHLEPLNGEGSSVSEADSLPDIEVRLVMKHSGSVPSISQ